MPINHKDQKETMLKQNYSKIFIVATSLISVGCYNETPAPSTITDVVTRSWKISNGDNSQTVTANLTDTSMTEERKFVFRIERTDNNGRCQAFEGVVPNNPKVVEAKDAGRWVLLDSSQPAGNCHLNAIPTKLSEKDRNCLLYSTIERLEHSENYIFPGDFLTKYPDIPALVNFGSRSVLMQTYSDEHQITVAVVFDIEKQQFTSFAVPADWLSEKRDFHLPNDIELNKYKFSKLMLDQRDKELARLQSRLMCLFYSQSRDKDGLFSSKPLGEVIKTTLEFLYTQDKLGVCE